MRRIFFVLFSTLIINHAFSRQIELYGNAPEYKNMSVTFYHYTDYITKEYEELVSTNIDSAGNFSCFINAGETLEIFTILGVYRAFLFIEPGEKYELVLPPRQDKTLIDELNQFFEEGEITLGVKNSDEKELNYLIFTFNNEFETFIAENFNWLNIFHDKAAVDSLEHALDSMFSYSRNKYFDVYKYYKYAMLRYFAYERNKLLATNKYLKNKPILYNNPAYMHFFNQLWNGYFISEYTTPMGKKLYESIVFGKSPSLVDKYFRDNIALRDKQLNELILLRGLFDGFEKPELYPRKVLYQTLDSIYIGSDFPEHKIIAKNIEKSTKVPEIGDKAIDFALPDQDSTIYSLENFRGKFVYLNFCRSENYTCMQQYGLMQTIKETFMDDIEIVTVSNDEDYGVFCSFLERNKDYDWHFLYLEDENELHKAYNIKALPTYYLLDPEGKIAIDPTLSPEQGFIQQFAQIMQWKKRAEESERYDDGIHHFDK